MVGRLFCLLLALSFATSSFAEGFYAGAGIGITQIEDEDQGFSFEDNPFGWRLLAGYDFNANFEGVLVRLEALVQSGAQIGSLSKSRLPCFF